MLLVFLGGDLVVLGWHKERKWSVIWGYSMRKQRAEICRKSCLLGAQSNNYLEGEHFSRNGTYEGGWNNVSGRLQFVMACCTMN